MVIASEEKNMMSIQNLDQFRELVLREPSLQARLSEPLELNRFLDLVREAGGTRGFDFTVEEVQQALNGARRAWLERWI